MKTMAPGVQHKSDVGGVVLDVADADGLRSAYENIASRLGPHVVVATMAPSGVEVALGIVRDPQFGALVLVAAGGILVEVLHDRRLALPPVDARGARALIDRLRIRPLLDGVRGAPAVDVDAIARAVSRLSVMAVDLGDQLDAVDVNPLIATSGGLRGGRRSRDPSPAVGCFGSARLELGWARLEGFLDRVGTFRPAGVVIRIVERIAVRLGLSGRDRGRPRRSAEVEDVLEVVRVARSGA